MGYLTGPLSRRIANFGQTPCLVLTFVVQVNFLSGPQSKHFRKSNCTFQAICSTLIILSVPGRSTFEPTNEGSLLIPSRFLHLFWNSVPTQLVSTYISLAIGFLFGVLDSCANTSRYRSIPRKSDNTEKNPHRAVMCMLAVPGKAPEVFCIARFWQVRLPHFYSHEN